MPNVTVVPSPAQNGQPTISKFDHAVAVTTSDANIYVDGNGNPVPMLLYVGGAGNVKVTCYGDADAAAMTFTAVPAGTVLPVRVTKVWATGTTATNMAAVS